MFASLFALAQVNASAVANAKQSNVLVGALKRVYEPHIFDIAFPIFAFLLVIVLPCFVALFIVYKTWTDR